MYHTLKKLLMGLCFLSLVLIPSSDLVAKRGGGHKHHGHHGGGHKHHGHHGGHKHHGHHGGHKHHGHHGHKHHHGHHHKYHHRHYGLYNYPYRAYQSYYPYQSYYSGLYPYSAYNYYYPSPSSIYDFQNYPSSISNYLYDDYRTGSLQNYPSYLSTQNSTTLELQALKRATNPILNPSLTNYPQVQSTNPYAYPANSPYK